MIIQFFFISHISRFFASKQFFYLFLLWQIFGPSLTKLSYVLFEEIITYRSSSYADIKLYWSQEITLKNNLNFMSVLVYDFLGNGDSTFGISVWTCSILKKTKVHPEFLRNAWVVFSPKKYGNLYEPDGRFSY